MTPLLSSESRSESRVHISSARSHQLLRHTPDLISAGSSEKCLLRLLASETVVKSFQFFFFLPPPPAALTSLNPSFLLPTQESARGKWVRSGDGEKERRGEERRGEERS
eukprot:3152779-Rhodomonas_salina.2